MRRIIFTLSLALPFAAVPGAVQGQEVDERLSAQQIVVTGTGLPPSPAAPAYNVQVIDRERLTQAVSGRIEDSLSAAAGFQQFRRSDSRASNPSAQGITLRALGGNATSRTLLLLDGVPMADPFFGYVPLSALAPEQLAYARVIRGGGSGAFGSGAVAGTIDLASAGPDQMGLINAGALVDDRGDTELSASLATRLGQGFAVVSGRWDRGPGFWTTPESQRGAASVKARYESWSGSVRAVAPLAPDIELQARVMAFNDNRTLRFRGADTGISGQDGSIRVVGRGPWPFDALAYLQSRDFHNVVVSARDLLPSSIQRATPSSGAGAKIEVRPPVGAAHALKLGADWRSANGRTIEENTPGGALTGRQQAGGSNSDIGLYMEDDWSLGPLVLTAGARADRWAQRNGFFRKVSLAGTVDPASNVYPDRAGWNGSFRAGAVLHAAMAFDLRAAAYTNLRQPTLNELYRTFTVAGRTTFNNPYLVNEQLRGFEAGFDWHPLDAVKLSATAFDNKIRNAIANVPMGSQQIRQNVDAVHSRGIEGAIDAKAGAFAFNGSVSYTDASVEAPGQTFDGKRPSQTPRWAASASAAWRPKDRWTLALTLRHVGEQFEDADQTAALPAATTLDAFAQVPLAGPFSLVLRGENLTDETVVTRNSGGTIDIGTPRTIWAGLRVEVR